MNKNQLETVQEKVIQFGASKDEKARRITNLAPDKVVSITAHEIESGSVTLEALEALEVPVMLYNTQATIHGVFPDCKNRTDALGYRSIIANANGSMGVKFIGIDSKKKSRIKRMIKIWRRADGVNASVSVTSQSFMVYRNYGTFLHDEKEKYLVALEQAKKDLESMPVCFYGQAYIAKEIVYGTLSLYLVAEIGAIYEKDVDSIIQWFTGKTIAETEAKIQFEKEELDKRLNEYNVQEEIAKKAREEKIAKAKETIAERIATDRPTGFIGNGNYTVMYVDMFGELKTATVSLSTFGATKIKHGRVGGKQSIDEKSRILSHYKYMNRI